MRVLLLNRTIEEFGTAINGLLTLPVRIAVIAPAVILHGFSRALRSEGLDRKSEKVLNVLAFRPWY